MVLARGRSFPYRSRQEGGLVANSRLGDMGTSARAAVVDTIEVWLTR